MSPGDAAKGPDMPHHIALPERWHCAERLESRRLLSGVGPDAEEASEVETMPLVAVPSIEVIELSLADEEDEEELRIDASELPAAVLAALKAAYPGARILEVEVEEEDGQTEYDVAATHKGRTLEVGMLASGEVIEVSQVLEPEDLPPEVMHWIDANFAGAELLEIELVTEGGFTSYELQFVPSGEPALEATIRVTAPATDTPAGPQAAPLDVGPLEAPAAVAEASSPLDEAAAGADGPGDGQPPAQRESAPLASAPVAIDVPLDSAAARVERALPAEAEPPTVLPEEATDQAPRIMPELAMLVGVTASELADLDRQLGLLLAEIQKLVQSLDGGGPAGNAGLAVALALILIAGAQLLRPDPASRPAQALALMKAHGDWSWSSWSATTMRR